MGFSEKNDYETDERHYNYYVGDRPLDSQVELLSKLESLGYEKDNKRILTNKNFGVPITAILLLIREAKFEIENIQNELKSRKEKYMITDKELEDSWKIDLGSSYSRNREWQIEKNYIFEENPSVSGSGCFVPIGKAFPEKSNNLYLPSYISSNNPEIKVCNHHIEKKEGDPIPLIRIYKSAFQFHEFSYALKERVYTKKGSNEISKFEGFFKTELKVPQLGKIFGGNISRRGSMIHGESIGFSTGTDLSINIAGNKLTKVVKVGLKEALNWIDSVYKEMLRVLEKNTK